MRFLQFVEDWSPQDSPSTYNGDDGQPANGQGRYIGIIIWGVLLMLLCCVIPAICAFRQGRQDRLAPDTTGDSSPDGLSDTGNAQKEQYSSYLKKALQQTTTLASADDFVVSFTDGHALSPSTVEENDIEAGYPSAATCGRMLRVSPDIIVTASCAICLQGYDEGDKITYSTNCRHAFHSACIESWIVDRQHSECPFCRQVFIEPPTVNTGNTRQTMIDDTAISLSISDGESLVIDPARTLLPSNEDRGQ